MKVLIKKSRWTQLNVYIFLVMLSCACNSYGQILNDEYAAGADVLILKNEIDIFSTIQSGVTLSVVECELVETCSASVKIDEVDQLITTIESRINSLSTRYTESGDAALEEVLVSYVDIRDGYNELLEKMNTMPQFEVEEEVTDEFGFDDFFGFGPATNAVSDEIQQLFQDYDEEELVDDEVIIQSNEEEVFEVPPVIDRPLEVQ